MPLREHARCLEAMNPGTLGRRLEKSEPAISEPQHFGVTSGLRTTFCRIGSDSYFESDEEGLFAVGSVLMGYGITLSNAVQRFHQQFPETAIVL